VLAALLLAQATVQVPVEVAPRDAANPLSRPAEISKLTLLIADAVKQDDPQPLCPDRQCTSLFRGEFAAAKTVAGPPMPESFTARLEMGSPFEAPYRLVLVVEQRDGAEPLVRAMRGFHYRTALACFESGELRGIEWQPQGQGISYRGQVLCVKE
jgi:hypothetical protein